MTQGKKPPTALAPPAIGPNEARWTKDVAKLLVGRKIVSVRYMTAAEADQCDFHSRPIVIELDNGIALYPMADDEGNDGGALATTAETLPTIGVFGLTSS